VHRGARARAPPDRRRLAGLRGGGYTRRSRDLPSERSPREGSRPGRPDHRLL